MRSLIGIILVAISATAFGTMPIFAHFAYDSGAQIITVLFFRYGIAAIALLSFMFLQKIPFPQGKNFWGLVGIGGVGFVLQSIAFFTALTLIPAGLVVLLLYLYPIIVTLVSITFLKEVATRSKLISVALAIAGTTLVVGPASGKSIVGILLGIASAIVYASDVLIGSQIMQKEDSIPAVTVIMTSAAIVLGGLALFYNVTPPTTALGWGSVLALGLFSSILAVVTLFAGIKRIGPTNASTLSTLEPIVAVILAAWILGEQITWMGIVGGLLILIAVVILAREELQLNESTKAIGLDS